MDAFMNENSKRQKLCITAMCFLSFFAYGLIIIVIPQTMRDLERMMQVSTAQFSVIFAVRSVFYSLGAVFFGWLYNKWNRQLLFALNMFICAVTTVLVPIIPKFYICLPLCSLCGMALGAVDTAANVLMLEMWGKDNNPFLQALHLSFALGSVVGPLMCTPFVTPDDNSTTSVFGALSKTMFTSLPPINTQILVPFGITAGISLLSAIGLFLCEIIKPYKTPERSVTRRERRHMTVNSTDGDTELLLPSQLPKKYYVSVVLLASFVVFMLLCAEPMFFNFLPEFLQKMGIQKKSSMYMSAMFGGGFTLFRFLSIFIAMKIKATAMLYTSLALTFVSSVTMIIFGTKSIPILWSTCGLMGAGFASLYPSLFSFIEERIDVTNIIGAVFMLAGSTATIITPLIIGHFIDIIPSIFLDFNMACVTVMIVMFVSLHFTDIWRSKYEANESQDSDVTASA